MAGILVPGNRIAAGLEWQFLVSNKSPEEGSSFDRSAKTRMNIDIYVVSKRILTFCIGK
jgi:hypothetical protein